MQMFVTRMWIGVLGLAGCTAWADDFGNAPDTYGTTIFAGGPQHIVVPSLRLGASVNSEPDGQPGVSPIDNDGVTIPAAIAGTQAILQLSAFNNTDSSARLVGWLDVNGNGVFDPAEGVQQAVPSSPAQQYLTMSFLVPPTADIDTGGSTYARFRLTTDLTATVSTPGGLTIDGEVEDYAVAVTPPGVSLSLTDNRADLVAGSATAYSLVLQYSGLTNITRVVDVPLDAAAVDVANATWSCVANAQASCVSGAPLGTGANGTAAISARSVDMQQGGRIEFTVNAPVRPNTALATFTTTATLDSGESASDTNNILAAPPVAAAAIPTLSQWGILLLTAFVGLAAWQRRSRHQESAQGL